MESPDVVDLKQATVLITGGTQGIGLGLAQRFLAAGSSVVITGRSAERIDELARSSPGLHGLVSDIGKPEDRDSLAARIEAEYPSLNVVINNAGIQRRIALAARPRHLSTLTFRFVGKPPASRFTRFILSVPAITLIYPSSNHLDLHKKVYVQGDSQEASL
jgi:NAD(P)-dependent dehydrogenase (short-subunit alcohol dehydrogenase family)